MQVNVLDAKNRLSELIRRAQDGETIVIANRGVPAVSLQPIRSNAAPRRGSARALLELIEREGPPKTQRSPEEIDADIADNRSAWD
jgi:prevent-host-death family protein